MSDSLLETFLRYGTNAQRLAFTPDPPLVSGVAVKVLYEWRETDTGDVYLYDTAWHLLSSGTATAITALTGDVTATGPGSVAATIANDAVTLAKIANASANDKLLGSGNSGSGANYAEIALGSGLTMTGTTLSAAGGGGGWTLLDTKTASSSPSLAFTSDITSTYNNYVFVLENVLPATDNQVLQFQYSTDNGSTYNTNNYYHAFGYVTGAAFSSNGTGPASQGVLTLSVGNAFEGVDGQLWLTNPLAGTPRLTNSYDLTFSTSTFYCRNFGTVTWVDSTPVNAMKFFYASGNIASGKIYLFGIQK